MHVGEVIDGRYTLLRLLGESSMGFSYEAEQLGTSDRVTVKLLHAHSAAIGEAIEECLKVEKEVGSIDSPHIAPVIENGIHEAAHYYVRPYLSGSDLSSMLDKNSGPLHPSQAIPLIRQACTGLEAALEIGCHHWNLKPRNLFVSRNSEGNEVVKVLDFGVSRIRDALAAEAVDSTVSGTSLGLPRYMPLEQIRAADDRDQRVDIYALGAILYELLTGSRPYDAESYTRLLLLVATKDPLPIKERRPAIGDTLASVVQRAMEREPKDRFQSLDELSSALEPLLNDISHEEPLVKERLSKRETSKTLPDIPLSEHVKRAAKLYEKREKKQAPATQPRAPSRRWHLVGLAVASSVLLSTLILCLVLTLTPDDRAGVEGSTSVTGGENDAAIVESWVSRCSYHYLAKRYDEAQEACTRGLDETDDIEERASLIYHLGRIAADRGDRRTARQHYEKAIVLDPDNPAILRRLEELEP